MSKLARPVAATEREFVLDAPLSARSPYVQVGDEIATVLGYHRESQRHRPDSRRLRVERGTSGGAQDHVEGATVTPLWQLYGTAPIIGNVGGGVQGERGPEGPKGEKGDKGDPGAAGPPGVDGQDGADGAPGTPGTPGTDGQPGTDGADGEDGASAYDIARAHGYGGTEAQWLTTLVGAKGDKGDTGNTGQTGQTGQTGAPGPSWTPTFASLGSGTALALATNDVADVSPSATATLTTTVPPAGRTRTVILRQTNTSAKTITFGSGFKPAGTLALGTTANRVFVLTFVSDGTNLYERSRTAALTA